MSKNPRRKQRGIFLQAKIYIGPSTLDVTAFAMIGALTLSTLDTKMGNKARQFDNLARFTQRIAEQYYPEL